MAFISSLTPIDRVNEELIYRVPTTEIDKIYFEDYDSMSKFSQASYLKALKIPVSFFRGLKRSTQETIILEQKNKIQVDFDSLYFMQEGDILTYNYTILRQHDYRNAVSCFDLTRPNFKLNCRDQTGKYRYFYSEYKLNPDVFVPGVFITFPIFLQGEIIINVGLYREACTNGAVDVKHFSSFKIKTLEFNIKVFDALIEGVAKACADKKEIYNDFNTLLAEKPLDTEDMTTKLGQMLKDRVLGAKVVSGCLNHIDLYNSGKDTPIEAPEDLQSYLDFMNLLTFYTQTGSKTLNARINNEGAIFNYLFDVYLEDKKVYESPPQVYLRNIYTNVTNSEDSSKN